MPLSIAYRPLDALAPYERNPRTHTPEQIRLIERSLAEYGWAAPMAVADGKLIYGHARRQAALNLRRRGVAIPGNPDPDAGPVVDLSHLSAEQRQAYVIADNQLAAQAGWDEELLRIELESLRVASFDLSLTGFGADEINAYLAIETPGEDDRGGLLDLADITTPEPKHQVTAGDHWRLSNRHHLLCVSVIEDWPYWRRLLKGDCLFVPYPGPFAPQGERAHRTVLVMVQPDVYAASVLLDRYAEAYGEDAVQRIASVTREPVAA